MLARAGARWLLGAALATAALALAAWPFVPGRVLATLALLTFPFAAALALGQRMLERRHAPVIDLGRAIVVAGGALVGAAAVYLTSCLSVWGPFDVATYAIDAVGVGLGALGGRLLVARSSWVEHARRGGFDDARATAALGALMGLLLLCGDAVIFPSGYFALHEALWAFGAAALVFAAQRWVTTLADRALPKVAGVFAATATACAVLASLATGMATPPVAEDARYLALSSLISHRAFVRSLWRALDRDGDGFSPYLGGTDCDDDDATAYPFSTVGRDCTRLDHGPPLGGPARTTAATGDLPAMARHAVSFAPRPRLVLLVTIDAFRCGFGRGESVDLRDVCPSLARLGAEGLLRTDVHTPATQTRWALGRLFGAEPARGRPSLPREMADLGFTSQAIPTCAYARAAAGVSDFQQIDGSLIAAAHDGATVSVDALHAKLLARGREALTSSEAPLFLWAHEMDPHAPYLATAGARLVLSPRHAYAAEIRRTDAALGKLVDELAAAARAPGDLWVVVSADHGEELGEHGLAFHGAQVFEESTRIPLVVWTSGADHRAPLSSALPAGLAEVGPYLAAALRGDPFTPSPSAVSWAPLTGDLAAVEGLYKVILHPRLGLFEAFDLRLDPHERAPTVGSFAPGEATTMPAWARPLALRLVSSSAAPD